MGNVIMNIMLKNISKAYDGLPILKNISLDFEIEKYYCIMGSSGLGKTTLLNILMGLLTPDTGTVENLDYTEIAAVFQENRLCENLSVGANLRLVCTKKGQMQYASQILDQLLLNGCLKKPVRQLSGGMQRRVSLARAVISNRNIMIWDEPFKGLDVTTRNKVIAYLKEHCKNKTVIWVTHDIQEYNQFGGELIQLDSLIKP